MALILGMSSFLIWYLDCAPPAAGATEPVNVLLYKSHNMLIRREKGEVREYHGGLHVCCVIIMAEN